jgi:hypothetical protein
VHSVQHDVKGLFDYVAGRLIDRLDGLSDEEYLWEPVPACWSVRPAADGTWVADVGPRGTPFTPEDPPPFTTIAWRLWHIGAAPARSWPPHLAGDAEGFVRAWFQRPGPSAVVGVGTAAEAIAELRSAWLPFGAVAASFSDADLFRPMGEVAGPFAGDTLDALLLHIADELVHHGAEVALLRDMYRAAH